MCKGLFRGKIKELCKYQDQWLIGYYAVDNGNPIIAITKDNGINGYICYSETIGRYTEQTDKNGTMIFEGDIISAHPDELFPDDEIRLVVEWHDYGWFGKDSKGKYTSLESKWVSELFEVIGNRFDNSELLKGE